MGDDAETESRMYAVTASGPTVACANFKAIDEGVLLFEDAKRKRASGFVPYAELKYVLPADATTREGGRARDAAAFDGDSSTVVADGQADDGGDSRSELTVLGGLGETYARRLRESGIDSLAAIRDADPERVASTAGVAEDRAKRWVTAAKRRDEGASSEGRAAAEASVESPELGAENDERGEFGADDADANDADADDADEEEDGASDDESEE